MDAGGKLEKAKEAAIQVVETLGNSDFFQVIYFSSNAFTFDGNSYPYTDYVYFTREQGRNDIDGVQKIDVLQYLEDYMIEAIVIAAGTLILITIIIIICKKCSKKKLKQ